MLLLALSLAVCSPVPIEASAPPEPITAATLLRELNDPLAVARWPEPWYRQFQSSSYDRATKSPEDEKGWFANNDNGQFDRTFDRDGRTESVMLEVDGPGAVVRVWSPNPKGTLRVYLDGSEEPAIEAPMEKLLDGSAVFPPGANQPLASAKSRGWNLFVPIPFAKHCLITTDDGKGVYYQVNWRKYPEGTVVASQSLEAILAACKAQWPALAGPRAGGAEESVATEVGPGGAAVGAARGGPRCVTAFHIDFLEPPAKEFLAKAQLAITCDGEETARMPLLAFFSTDGVAKVADSRRAFDGQSFACSWPMPFERSIEVRLENGSSVGCKVAVRLATAPWTWDERSMRFHATWCRDPKLHTRPFRDYRFTAIKGQGVYVGDTLEVVNPVDAWWGEGDEKIYVDGEPFPSHIGTGTEDYYGYGWCCQEPFAHPLHSQTVCEGLRYGTNYGRTIVSRLRGLDAIPFTASLVVDMEVWHWAECDFSYAPATFWYARPGSTWEPKTDRVEAARGQVDSPPPPPVFVIEGAIECEDMAILAKSQGLETPIQGMKQYGQQGWSNERHLWCQGQKVGDFVELAVPAPDAAPRRLILHATKSWDYGILAFSVNGRPAGKPVDCFSGQPGKVTPSGPIDLGMHTPENGRFVIRVEVVGGNPQSAGSRSFFGLDAVLLEAAP